MPGLEDQPMIETTIYFYVGYLLLMLVPIVFVFLTFVRIKQLETRLDREFEKTQRIV